MPTTMDWMGQLVLVNSLSPYNTCIGQQWGRALRRSRKGAQPGFEPSASGQNGERANTRTANGERNSQSTHRPRIDGRIVSIVAILRR